MGVCGNRNNTYRNIAHGVVILFELECSNKVPSRLRGIPWLVPADIIHIKVEWRYATRIDIDGLFQTVRGKGVGGGLKTEAL